MKQQESKQGQEKFLELNIHHEVTNGCYMLQVTFKYKLPVTSSK